MPAPAFDTAWLAHSALLLVDMNRSHLDHSIGHLLVEKQEADRIIEAAVRARDLAAAAGLPIIFVRTHHRHDPRTDTIVDNKNPFWIAQQNAVIPGFGKPRRSTAIEGAPVTEVVPALAPRPGEHTVFKHRYSAFENTDLEHLLRNLEIETLIICGVNTNNCVLCACFDAFNRDYRVLVLKDVCASMNGPDYHEAALKLIEAALGWVIHSDELADMLRRPTAA
jgi:nicotinamidase-related amidase